MLYSVKLVPHSEIQRETRLESPRIVEIHSPLVIDVAARELWRAYRQSNGLAWSRSSLWIDRYLKAAQIPIHEIVKASLVTCSAERGDRVLVGSKRAIVLHIDIHAAKAKRVLAARVAEVFVNLANILRTSKRNRAARAIRQVTSKGDPSALERGHDVIPEIIRRLYRCSIERLQQIQPVED